MYRRKNRSRTRDPRSNVLNERLNRVCAIAGVQVGQCIFADDPCQYIKAELHRLGGILQPPERGTLLASNGSSTTEESMQYHHLFSAFQGKGPTDHAEPEVGRARPHRDRIPKFKLSFTAASCLDFNLRLVNESLILICIAFQCIRIILLISHLVKICLGTDK